MTGHSSKPTLASRVYGLAEWRWLMTGVPPPLVPPPVYAYPTHGSAQQWWDGIIDGGQPRLVTQAPPHTQWFNHTLGGDRDDGASYAALLSAVRGVTGECDTGCHSRGHPQTGGARSWCDVGLVIHGTRNSSETMLTRLTNCPSQIDWTASIRHRSSSMDQAEA